MSEKMKNIARSEMLILGDQAACRSGQAAIALMLKATSCPSSIT